MAIDPDKLLALEIPPTRHRYTWRDTVLYALGTGHGIDPMDERQLRFVDETRLLATPTMANVLAYPGSWMRDMDTGIDYLKVVHGEQSMRLSGPLPVEADVIGRTRIVDLVDKGPGRGALLYIEREITEAQSGRHLATVLQTAFCRGDGGFGGKATSTQRALEPVPDRAPDLTISLPTHPQLALIYRLSGDYNPLHADPQVARKAGFDRPILHGLATYGVAGHALVAGLCGYAPEKVRGMEGRFSAPVYPGENIAVDIWHQGPGRAAFRARVPERAVVVLSHGACTYEA